MKKILSCFLAVVMLAASLTFILQAASTLKVFAEDEVQQKLTGADSDFEGIKDIKETKWTTFSGGSIALEAKQSFEGSQCMKFTPGKENYMSFCYDLYPLISSLKESGEYTVSFMYKIDYKTDRLSTTQSFASAIRGKSEKDENSFITENSGTYFYSSKKDAETADDQQWHTYSITFSVEDGDLDGGSHSWMFVLHHLNVTDINAIYIDQFQVSTGEETKDSSSEKEEIPMKAETWVCKEMTLLGKKTSYDALNSLTLDLTLKGPDGQSLTIPGFYDGGNAWKVRFALPKAGTWTFQTVCSDQSETGLIASGSIQCTAYSGKLDIYKHGFVTALTGKKYFTYADGTPFFYLGDTHWSMAAEEYDSAGGNQTDSGAASHFRYIVDQRVKQGFTVYQSEPIGMTVNLMDKKLTASDITGFQDLDRYYAYIADAGLVHACAMLAYVTDLPVNMDKTYLEQITRYWVARYGAYPVLWTLAQETDGTYHFTDPKTNPWVDVFQYVYKYDVYVHPLSAHMDGTSRAVEKNVVQLKYTYFFDQLKGYSWYPLQWKPCRDTGTKLTADMQYVEYLWSTDKPGVVYEPTYENLACGARGVRGNAWIGFLCGLYGFGYGAQDIWLYHSTYMQNDTTKDMFDSITPEMKQVKWGDMVNNGTPEMLGVLKKLMNQVKWYELLPRFSDVKYVKKNVQEFFTASNEDSSVVVSYQYSATDQTTGTLKNLQNTTYYVRWINPSTGETGEPTEVKVTDGTYALGNKPDLNDWVVLLYTDPELLTEKQEDSTATEPAASTATPIGTITKNTTNKHTPGWLYAVICGGVLVVVGGAVTAVVFLKKKQQEKKDDPEES